MRNPNRIPKVTTKLAEAWSLAPDLRLGQFLSAIIGGSDGFYVEEEEWVKRFDEFIEKNQTK